MTIRVVQWATGPVGAVALEGEQGADDEADRCAVMGVFTPLTFQIGQMQAAAALKLITGVGSVAISQLTIVNALQGTQHSVQVPQDTGCSVCGSGV